MVLDLRRPCPRGIWITRASTSATHSQARPKPDIRTMLIRRSGGALVPATSRCDLGRRQRTVAHLRRMPGRSQGPSSASGTSDLVGSAIEKAVEACGMPPGVFSMLHGASHEVGLALVRHPAAKAVAFTGSLGGGRALFDAAAARPEPIPVYAEMGSINPVILLPDALAASAEQIAAAYIKSVTMGVGQYCTNPGLVLGMEDASLERFASAAGRATFRPRTSRWLMPRSPTPTNRRSRKPAMRAGCSRFRTI